ncbi:type II secretion system minor pseudopilin GspK [Dokdonella soli]|uniref:Type II secretion system protein K n=1 Tax=Dokdonella soli TaxID=529810 RepID=A0ABP3U3H7_9GAMM
MTSLPRRQRGVALLVALLVVALAVILIAALLDRGELAYARTRNVLRSEQADAYAHGLEIYAAQILQASLSLNPGVDTNASPWALPLPPQPVPGGVISATMRDLNGCFNLNNLMPPPLGNTNYTTWNAVFKRLLIVQGIDQGLATSIQNWFDPSGISVDDNYYFSLPVPYRASHRSFAHVSELRLVRGVTGDVYARLAPYVCALPPNTKININTASVPVLRALGASQLTQAQGERLWQNGQAYWREVTTLADKWNRLDIKIDPALVTQTPLLDVASTYFLARGEIVLDAVPFTFYSLIERPRQGLIRVLERSRGSDDALVAPAPLAIDGGKDTTLH